MPCPIGFNKLSVYPAGLGWHILSALQCHQGPLARACQVCTNFCHRIDTYQIHYIGECFITQLNSPLCSSTDFEANRTAADDYRYYGLLTHLLGMIVSLFATN